MWGCCVLVDSKLSPADSMIQKNSAMQNFFFGIMAQ
jgi:hypothetical protein